MKQIMLYGILFLACVSAVSAAGREIRIKKGSSRVVRVDNAEKIEIIKKDVVSATILSGEEIIIEGKKVGTSVVNVRSAKGIETIMVKVKKQAKKETMIEIDVQILEIINSDELGYGIDWPVLINGGLPQGGLPMSPLNAIEQSPPFLKSFGAEFQRGQINVLVDFLVKKNYGKILAKPKLLTANGQKAHFLVGGEVPVITTTTLGQSSVEWKEYGVGLEINPEITGRNNIRAKLKAEVSNLDYTNTVSVSGDIMPAVRTRRAETTITIEPDNTIIIAGLIQNEEARVTEGVPVLSLIPLIGELFKNTRIENRKTELVIFVTPRISGGGGI